MMRKKHHRTRTRHFGDNPRVRHSHRESSRINWAEPWERSYAKRYRRIIRVKGHTRKNPSGGRRVKVHGYHRLFRKWHRK